MPRRTPAPVEDAIVALRKELTELGVDAGAHTIAHHLERRQRSSPSVATILRVLSRRGFVTPQPQKRPRSSFIRFEADMPNERWQADITHWRMGGGSDVETLHVLDDHSRLLVAAKALGVFKAADVVATFHEAAAALGFPASVLTDNGAVFTAVPRGGRCAMELELASLGIRYLHSTPYHPQTCGKVERLHQTVKRYLTKQPRPDSVGKLQAQLDAFVATTTNQAPPRPRQTHAGRGVHGQTEGGPFGTQARDPRRTFACGETGSTSPGLSHFVTTPGCITSGSVAASSGRGSWCSSTVFGSAC